MYIDLSKIISILAITAFSIVGCRKGNLPPAEKSFASIKIDLLNLPGTPQLDIYAEDIMLDSVKAGELKDPVMLEAGKEFRLFAKKHLTQEILLDTLMKLKQGTANVVRMAYSEDLDLKKFMNGGGTISPDSMEILFYNDLTTLQPDGLELIPELEKMEEGTFTFIDILGPINKKKMIGKALRIGLDHVDGGGGILLRLSFRNAATGELVMDQGNGLYANFGILAADFAGKTAIATINQIVSRQRQRWNTNIAAL